MEDSYFNFRAATGLQGANILGRVKLRPPDTMSDFTDDEDRQLVQLAQKFSRNGRKIQWNKLTQQMKGTKKRKEALRQRLKTLKRTHGRSLENFPKWFFKKKFATKSTSQRLQASRHTSAEPKPVISEKDNLLQLAKKTRYTLQGCAEIVLQSNGTTTQMPTKLDKYPMASMSPRSAKCVSAMKAEPPTSLLLLASVASTTGYREEVMDSCCS